MQKHLSKDFARRGGVKDVMAQLIKRAGAGITVLCLLTIGALVAGCGSGGGGGDGAGASPQVVSGVAATGSPLAGGQVTLRDSASVRNEKVGEIDNNGSFAINVADMTAPFILKATGTADGVSRTMFSFADKPGIANINPFSSVALANAAGVDDPADVFDKSDSAMLDKVKSGMSGSVATLQSRLQPLLDEFSAGSANPVSDRFEANHEGLDAVFDNVKVVIANGILTITNVDTGVVLFTAQVKEKEFGNGRFTDRDEDVPKHGRPRPAAPTGVTTVGGGPGSNQVTVSWDPVANATSYDLFYTTASKAAEDDDHEGEDSKKRIKNVTSPFVVTGLDPATTYFFIVRARIDGRKGPRSAEVPGTPSSTTPSTAPTTSTTSTTTGATTSTTAGATTSTTAGATTSTTAGATTSSTGATTSSTGATTTTTVLPPPPTTTTTTAPTTTTTTTTATTTSTTLAALNGAALYATNCANCHNALANSEFRGASVNAINNGIAGVGSMRNTILATNGGIPLTQPQITAISLALQ